MANALKNPIAVDTKEQQSLWITKEDLDVLESAFKGNDTLFKVLLKVFLPSATDPNMPVEFREDIWGGVDYRNMLNDEAKVAIIARHDLINWVRDRLMYIKSVAEHKEMYLADGKDSTK